MLASNLVPLAAGQLVRYQPDGRGTLANVSVKTAGAAQLNIYDGIDNTGVLVASIAVGFVGTVQVERTFDIGLYAENGTGWVGSIGLG